MIDALASMTRVRGEMITVCLPPTLRCQDWHEEFGARYVQICTIFELKSKTLVKDKKNIYFDLQCIKNHLIIKNIYNLTHGYISFDNKPKTTLKRIF